MKVPDQIYPVAESSRLGALIGAALTALIHIALPLVSLLIALVLGWFSGFADRDDEFPKPEPSVTAHFARLGVEVDPKSLPEKVQPKKSPKRSFQRDNAKRGAPRDRAPSTSGQKEKPDPTNIVRELVDTVGFDTPDEGTADLAGLVDVTDDASDQGASLAVGSADGVEGGDSDAATGNEYLGKLALIFRRGWTVPTTVDEATLKTLKAQASMSLDTSMRVTHCSIRKGSGNAVFDESILSRCEALRASNESMPEPPLSVESQFRNATVTLRVSGRQIRR